jgi:hypothetical protein
MDVNNPAFLSIGLVFGMIGLAQRNLAFGFIGLTFLILAFSSDEEE